MDITDLPTATLAYMLGVIAANGGGAKPGRAYLLASELHRRGEFEPMTAALEPELQTSLNMVIANDRSRARWGTGQRRLSAVPDQV